VVVVFSFLVFSLLIFFLFWGMLLLWWIHHIFSVVLNFWKILSFLFVLSCSFCVRSSSSFLVCVKSFDHLWSVLNTHK
jgi:hypothetical protein